MKKHISIALLAALAAALTLANEATAAIIYSTAGSSYSQNFDSLPNAPQNTSLGNTTIGWTDDNAAPGAGNFSIVGWYLLHPATIAEGGFNGRQRMRIGAGTANTGAFMSFGASGSTERALGMVNSNTFGAVGTESYYGARITNNTGRMLTSFTLSYSGEQWRDGGAALPALPNAQSITVDYSRTATSLETAAVYQEVPALTFTSPTFANTGGGAALDGNDASLPAPINKIAIGPVTVNNLQWMPGTDLWVRWTDLSDAGNDHGLGIDEVVFSAEIPEPASFVFFTLGLIGGCVVRRSR